MSDDLDTRRENQRRVHSDLPSPPPTDNDDFDGPPSDQAEVIEVAGGRAWLRFRDTQTGKLNELMDMGEEDPRPIEDVRAWARSWNTKMKARWPDSWILAEPAMPMKAGVAASLIRRLQRVETVWLPVTDGLYSKLNLSPLALSETLGKLPDQAPALIEVDGGRRFMITKAHHQHFERLEDGMARVVEPEDYTTPRGLFLWGRRLEEGEVVVPRGLPIG